jgi:signal recognition particle receptor subunit beta
LIWLRFGRVAAIAKNAGIPVLFFANKMDLPKALGAAEISERLELPALLNNRQFTIVFVILCRLI